jgi:geranylgeranyl pyrophosphate synthase
MELPFPKGSALKDFLNLAHSSELEDLFDKSLTTPLNDFFLRPRKNIRNQVVQLGFSLAAKKVQHPLTSAELEAVCNACCAVLEIFHAGSLVVDDIQDDSQFRRGKQTLHQIYGMPLALNAGNWLYFLPFKYIEEMPLPPENRSALIRECSDTLLRAHYGQALDLGIPVDSLEQERVPEVCLAAMELKSGVLTGLAFKMGAVALGASEETIAELDSAGRKIGVALQMMDDLGCLTSKNNPAKRCEDLKLKRLGFIFSSAAELLPASEYSLLQELLQHSGDNLEEILALLSKHHVAEIAKQKAVRYLENTIEHLQIYFSLNSDERTFIETIQTHLVKSYE